MRSHIALAIIILTICAATCYAFEPGTAGNSSGIVGHSSIWNSFGSSSFSSVGNTVAPSNSGSLCPFSDVSTGLGEHNILIPSTGLPTLAFVGKPLDISEIPHPLYSTGESNIPHVWGTSGIFDSAAAPRPISHTVGTSDVPNNLNRSIITTDTFSLCGGAGVSSTPNVSNGSRGLGLSGIFQFHPSGSAGSAPLCPFANR